MRLYLSLLLPLLLLSSGCTRYFPYVKCNFIGGEKLCVSCPQADCFVCSMAIYDAFQTKGRFETLWLNDVVRTYYVDKHAQRTGMTDQAKAELLQQHLKEAQEVISFFMLLPYTDVEPLMTPKDVYPPWATYLIIDNQKIHPISVKKVDLDPEYAALIGKNWFNENFIRFRIPYLVTFNPLDAGGYNLLDGVDTFEIVISSTCYRARCTYHKTQGALCDCDCVELL